jgi:hypothetical protein
VVAVVPAVVAEARGRVPPAGHAGRAREQLAPVALGVDSVGVDGVGAALHLLREPEQEPAGTVPAALRADGGLAPPVGDGRPEEVPKRVVGVVTEELDRDRTVEVVGVAGPAAREVAVDPVVVPAGSAARRRRRCVALGPLDGVAVVGALRQGCGGQVVGGRGAEAAVDRPARQRRPAAGHEAEQPLVRVLAPLAVDLAGDEVVATAPAAEERDPPAAAGGVDAKGRPLEPVAREGERRGLLQQVISCGGVEEAVDHPGGVGAVGISRSLLSLRLVGEVRDARTGAEHGEDQEARLADVFHRCPSLRHETATCAPESPPVISRRTGQA